MSTHLQQRMDELIANGSVAAVKIFFFFVIFHQLNSFSDIEKNRKNARKSPSMESRNDG